MSRGLGKLERAILLAVYHRQVVTETKEKEDPILHRDELPELLWGWQPIERRWWHSPRIYFRWAYPDYAAKQASLTRALHSLERKALIITGDTYCCYGRPIYSERQAAARGIEPAKTLREYGDEELDKVRHDLFTGAPFTWRRSRQRSLDVRFSRNAKALRLTETGMLQAAALACADAGSISVKSEKRIQDLTLTEEVYP